MEILVNSYEKYDSVIDLFLSLPQEYFNEEEENLSTLSKNFGDLAIFLLAKILI